MRVFVSRRDRRTAIAWLGVVVVAFVALTLAVRAYAPGALDPRTVRAFVLGFGPWAPVVYVAITVAQVVVAPIPGQVLGVAAGYLFGPVAGTAYSVLGVAIGSALTAVLARRYGRPYVERVVTPATLARFDGAAEDDAAFALFLAYLVPGLPDDAISFVGGLTTVPLWKLVALAAVGRAPGFALAAFAGAELDARPLVGVAVLLALGLLSVVGYLARDRLTARLGTRR